MDLQHTQDNQIKGFQANLENKVQKLQAKYDLNRLTFAQFPGYNFFMSKNRCMKIENGHGPKAEKSSTVIIIDQGDNTENIKQQIKKIQEHRQNQQQKTNSYQKNSYTFSSKQQSLKKIKKIGNIQTWIQLQRNNQFVYKKDQKSVSKQKEDFAAKYPKLPCSFCDKLQTLQEMDKHHNNCKMAFKCRNCHDFFPYAIMYEHNRVCQRKQNLRRQQNANRTFTTSQIKKNTYLKEDYATEQQLRFLRQHEEIPPQLLIEHLRAQKEKNKQKKPRKIIFGQYLPPHRIFQAQFTNKRHFQSQPEEYRFSNTLNSNNFLQINRNLQNNHILGHKKQQIQGLKDYQIKNLVTDCYRKGQNEEVDLCAICNTQKEENETIVRLPCFHTFHKQCIIPWVKMKSVCPSCKHDIKSK